MLIINYSFFLFIFNMGTTNDSDEQPQKKDEYIQTVIVQIKNTATKCSIGTDALTPNKDLLSFDQICSRIEDITGFTSYNSFKVKLNQVKKKIKGMYFQFDRGCILYALINEGWVDEKYIPDSMKYYKNHTYSQDTRNFKYSLLIIIRVVLMPLLHLMQ